LPKESPCVGSKGKSEMTATRVLTRTVGMLGISCAVVFGGTRAKSVAAKPLEVLQGQIAELKVSDAGLTAIKGRMGKERIPFYPSDGGAYAALVGVDLEAKPGLATVLVTGTTASGQRRQTPIVLKIMPKEFEKESFSVSKAFDQLTPETLERIRRDQNEFARAFATSVPERLWEAPFIMPVHAGISSSFGYRRVINGIARAPHTGVDLRVPMGTEVLAANRGRVALIGDFFFSGNSLVLDHGGGLYTMYFHLSEIKVEQGEEVQKGEVIALSGMTGRVTGPHLHWGALINGARVDPFELVNRFGGLFNQHVHLNAATDTEEK